MLATATNSFKQALVDTVITTHYFESNKASAEEEIPSPRLLQRHNKSESRTRIRSTAILPDRRLALERRSMLVVISQS